MSKITSKTKDKDIDKKSAPHRIVNWEAMQKTVNPYLSKCEKCKKKGLRLVESLRTSLASTFELDCALCKNEKSSLRNHIHYLKTQYDLNKTRERYVDIANQKAKLKIRDLIGAEAYSPNSELKIQKRLWKSEIHS